jgi:outer membrane protein assembly factor BamB
MWTYGILLVLLLVLTVGAGAAHAQPSPAGAPPAPDVTPAQPADADAIYRVYLPRVSRGLPAPTPRPTGLPPVQPPGSAANEWTQFGHDAQRTAFQPVAIPTPWRWKWSWNGARADGSFTPDRVQMPRNSQPITGGGRVYIAAGETGVVALNADTGAVLWKRSPGGAINSTPAYHPALGALFVVSSNGTLYKLDAATGNTLGQVAGGQPSPRALPPALAGHTVFFSTGTQVRAVASGNLELLWSYDAGAMVDTPPAYSVRNDTVVVLSRDLYVHAVQGRNGGRLWRVKPTSRTPNNSENPSATQAEVQYGWPVIAEAHNLVFIRYRLDWETLWTWSPFPSGNEAIRAALVGRPDVQALFALRLSDGGIAFVPNTGNSAWGDGNVLPMGPMPVIKRFADGSEVAYVSMRGTPCLPNTQKCDGRGDGRLGELMLDDSTIPGYQAGYVRYMLNTHLPTDEMPFLTVAGDQLLAGHWEAGLAHQIQDRSPARGTGDNPIPVSNLPHIVTSQDNDYCKSGFIASHYCWRGVYNTRLWPGGFYVYWKEGPVYQRYFTWYSSWVVSAGLVLYITTDGSLVALEAGPPSAAALDGSTTDVSAVAPALAGEPLPAAPPSTPEPIHGPANLPVVAAADAQAYARQVVTVEGTLQEVFNNGKAVYLGFHKPHAGHFLAKVGQQAWATFPAPPETLFAAGDRVQISGRIGWYQRDPVIEVSNPAQIRLLSRGVPAERPADAAAPDAPAPFNAPSPLEPPAVPQGAAEALPGG